MVNKSEHQSKFHQGVVTVRMGLILHKDGFLQTSEWFSVLVPCRSQCLYFKLCLFRNNCIITNYQGSLSVLKIQEVLIWSNCTEKPLLWDLAATKYGFKCPNLVLKPGILWCKKSASNWPAHWVDNALAHLYCGLGSIFGISAWDDLWSLGCAGGFSMVTPASL